MKDVEYFLVVVVDVCTTRHGSRNDLGRVPDRVCHNELVVWVLFVMLDYVVLLFQSPRNLRTTDRRDHGHLRIILWFPRNHLCILYYQG